MVSLKLGQQRGESSEHWKEVAAHANECTAACYAKRGKARGTYASHSAVDETRLAMSRCAPGKGLQTRGIWPAARSSVAPSKIILLFVGQNIGTHHDDESAGPRGDKR